MGSAGPAAANRPAVVIGDAGSRRADRCAAKHWTSLDEAEIAQEELPEFERLYENGACVPLAVVVLYSQLQHVASDLESSVRLDNGVEARFRKYAFVRFSQFLVASIHSRFPGKFSALAIARRSHPRTERSSFRHSKQAKIPSCQPFLSADLDQCFARSSPRYATL
jgi:hypothetical protein